MTALGAAEFIAFVAGRNVVQTRLLRFTALEHRGGGNASGRGPGIATFGPLLDGCLDSAAGVLFNATVDGAALTLAFESIVAMNGWWYAVAPGAPSEDDPIRFRLEYADGDSGSGGAATEASRHWKQVRVYPCHTC